MKDYKKPVTDPFEQFKPGDTVLIGHSVGNPLWSHRKDSRVAMYEYEYPAYVPKPHPLKCESIFVPPITDKLEACFLKRLYDNDIWALVDVNFNSGPTIYAVPIGFVKPLDYE